MPTVFPPRLVVAALRGGSGKTVLSLGLLSLWRGKGAHIAPFKKGPDFIDSGWLGFAGGRPCRNLDPFLMDADQIVRSFARHAAGADLALIEGNRGLYDGLDLQGCCSTAELAKLLRAPVLIIVDVTMATRTIAAIVKGCQVFDPSVTISGVILNRVAGSRQETLVREAIETYCGLPVVGAIPKLRGNPFPERHMGLVPQQERDEAARAVSWARSTVETYLETDALWRMAHGAEPVQIEESWDDETSGFLVDPPLRIGYLRDRSFWFYYPENLEQIEDSGASLVVLDALRDPRVPELDALYIGGGFPETQAAALADNRNFREGLRKAIENGLPVYAECGGLMYLGKHLLLNGKAYPMVGALPVEFVLDKRPQGHGYTVMEVAGANPYYAVGESFRGHEFHYSRPIVSDTEEVTFVFKVVRGHGVDGSRDGFRTKNLLATYTHVHAGGDLTWAKRLCGAAARFRRTGAIFLENPKISD